MKDKKILVKLGAGLMLFSLVFFAALVVIPLSNLENTVKLKLGTFSLIAAEILFWGGGILVGKELFTKYKSYFNPKNWFKKWKTKN